MASLRFLGEKGGGGTNISAPTHKRASNISAGQIHKKTHPTNKKTQQGKGKAYPVTHRVPIVRSNEWQRLDRVQIARLLVPIQAYAPRVAFPDQANGAPLFRGAFK